MGGKATLRPTSKRTDWGEVAALYTNLRAEWLEERDPGYGARPLSRQVHAIEDFLLAYMTNTRHQRLNEPARRELELLRGILIPGAGPGALRKVMNRARNIRLVIARDLICEMLKPIRDNFDRQKSRSWNCKHSSLCGASGVAWKASISWLRLFLLEALDEYGDCIPADTIKKAVWSEFTIEMLLGSSELDPQGLKRAALNVIDELPGVSRSTVERALSILREEFDLP